MTLIKPCPFCLNDEVIDWGESTWSSPVKWMYCTDCQSQGPRIMMDRDEDYGDWLLRTITAWNTRA